MAGPGSAIDALERVMADHWRALERDHLGDWLLRACGGFTGRANSVLTVGDPGTGLPTAIAAVTAWYAARGLPPTASLPAPVEPSALPAAAPAGSRPTVAAEGPERDRARERAAAFTAAGWQVLAGAGAYVLTASVAELAATGAAALPGRLTLDLAAEPDAGWLAGYRYRGQELPPQARALLLSAADQVFCSIRDGDRTVAVARGSLSGGWAGVTAVEVDPQYRRRGLARILLGAVARWAGPAGAGSAYLQVGDGNEAALTLYFSAGLTLHHRYDYLRPA
ncbi:MAG TPA: GNAT family N-acetyltransferase [Kineosporiaceae bacterium]|nr:GNAT family N-acetyltransferase [Kineosporiaceae bacterium]